MANTTAIMSATLLLAGAAGLVPQRWRPAPKLNEPNSTSERSVVLVDSEPSINLRSIGDAEFEAYVLLRNRSDRNLTGRLSIVLRDRSAVPLTVTLVDPGDDITLEACKTTPVHVRAHIADGSAKASTLMRAALPASGVLRYSPTEGGCNDADCLHLPVSIPAPPLQADGAAAIVFLVACGLAALVVLAAAARLWLARISPLRRMGSAIWTFTDSWGTNVTIGATLLTTMLGLTLFPEYPRIMTRGSYALLSALLSGVVALAAPVYGLARSQAPSTRDGLAATGSDGYVFMFLVAGGLVLWGALGQVLTLALVSQELVEVGLDPAIGRALQVLAVALAGLLVVYGLRTLSGIPRSSAAAEVSGTAASAWPLL